MVRKYHFEIDKQKQDELDSDMFEYGLDDYVWWEEKNQCLVTDNVKVLHDLEAMFEEHDIEYTVTEEQINQKQPLLSGTFVRGAEAVSLICIKKGGLMSIFINCINSLHQVLHKFTDMFCTFITVITQSYSFKRASCHFFTDR